MGVDSRVGPYRILRLINRGGQGSVYLGYDRRLHRRVAIKIYSLPPQRAARKRLLREAQLVASIQSAKVVQIHDVIESSEHLALVMEYVPGCDLAEFLAAVRPSLGSVLAIGADIAGALAVARQQRIVHGDLKAGNVLIAESGRVKLTDFGIARSAMGTAAQDLAGGSLSALSPEQYLGKPLDVRSDLFALGCLLYRMLTGEHPFFRGGQLDSRLLLGQSPRPVEERVAPDVVLPGELVNLIGELLQREPEDRPSNTHRVRQVLRSVCREIPLAATNSLLEEARPYFRAESAEDIPPLIPAELGREGRSRMAPGGGRGPDLWYRLARSDRTSRWAVALGLAALAAVPLVIALQDVETVVHIDEPVLRINPHSVLPDEISRSWLVEAVKAGVSEGLGAIRFTAPAGVHPGRILYGGNEQDSPQPKPREQLQIGLRCLEALCVFSVGREYAGARYNQQAVLFPDMPIGEWHDIVRGTTRALYP